MMDYFSYGRERLGINNTDLVDFERSFLCVVHHLHVCLLFSPASSCSKQKRGMWGDMRRTWYSDYLIAGIQIQAVLHECKSTPNAKNAADTSMPPAQAMEPAAWTACTNSLWLLLWSNLLFIGLASSLLWMRLLPIISGSFYPLASHAYQMAGNYFYVYLLYLFSSCYVDESLISCLHYTLSLMCHSSYISWLWVNVIYIAPKLILKGFLHLNTILREDMVPPN